MLSIAALMAVIALQLVECVAQRERGRGKISDSQLMLRVLWPVALLMMTLSARHCAKVQTSVTV